MVHCAGRQSFRWPWAVSPGESHLLVDGGREGRGGVEDGPVARAPEPQQRETMGSLRQPASLPDERWTGFRPCAWRHLRRQPTARHVMVMTVAPPPPPADVAIEGLSQLLAVRGLPALGVVQLREERCHHARRAEPALRRVVGRHPVLDRVHAT